MKRIPTLIASLLLFILVATAQTRPLVTLSHEGQLTFFDKISALEDAVAAAVDGDVLYLSEGKFGASKQSFTINKKISIIGCGYDSHIIPDITVKFSGSVSLTAPLFDGVRLEQLLFSTPSNRLIEQVEIKKCKVGKISLANTNNTMLDRCIIGTYIGISERNIKICNCKISRLESRVCEIVENCNINEIYDYSPGYITNSIIEKFRADPVNGVYENCLIGSLAGINSSSNTIRNCYDMTNTGNTDVLDDNLECTIADMSPYVGVDGTVVGAYGGQWFPYSETPSVPTVDSANSSVEYDKETNKLNVTITVAPN